MGWLDTLLALWACLDFGYDDTESNSATWLLFICFKLASVFDAAFVSKILVSCAVIISLHIPYI